MALNRNITDIETEISSIPFFSRMDWNDYYMLFDNHLSKLMRFLLIYQQDTYRPTFGFTRANYWGLEEFILEDIDSFEKDRPTFEVDWDFVEEAKKRLRIRLLQALGDKAQEYYLFIKFTISCFENYLMYETAHPNSVNNPWADVWNIIKKGYIFFVTDIEKEIAEYLPHKVTTNGNIVLILASPHHEIMHKTIDNSFNIQFLLFKFLQEKGFGKENAQPMAAILEALNIVQDATFDKAVKHLKMNKLIQIDAQQGLFIPKDEDIKAAEEDAKLEREYNYHIQKAQEIANIRERNYIHNTQHNSNFQNV